MKFAALALLALTACANTSAIPPERLMCHAAVKPAFPPIIPVDWGHVMNLGDAREQHEGYVSRQQVREWVMGKYIADLESKLTQCTANMDWLRERVR